MISDERKQLLVSGIEDPVSYVKVILQDMRIQPKPDGRLVRVLGSGALKEEDLNTICSEVRTQYRYDFSFLSVNLRKKEKKNLVRYTGQALSDGLELFLTRTREEHELALEARIAFDGSTEAEDRMKDFLRALLNSEPSIMQVGSMLHWMACVKRHIYRKPVSWHIVPVLVGPNGMGKSRALDRLLLPLADDVYSINDVAAATEEQGRLSLAKSFVVRFDEMGRVDRADLGKLKGMITSDKVTTRILYTNLHSTRSTRTSFIGSANFDISQLVPDTSGMRRWFQLNVEKQSNFDAINQFDSLALWKSVDPDRDYRAPIAKLLEAAQEDMRRKTPVEFFVEVMGLKPEPGGGAVEHARYKSLYEEFKDFAKEYGEEQLSLRTFLHAMQTLRFERGRTVDTRYLVVAYPRTTEEGRASRKDRAGYEKALKMVHAGAAASEGGEGG